MDINPYPIPKRPKRIGKAVAAAGAFKFKPSGGANASEKRKPNTSSTRRTLEYRPKRDNSNMRPLGPARPSDKKRIKPLDYKKAPRTSKRTVYGLRDIYSGMRYKRGR